MHWRIFWRHCNILGMSKCAYTLEGRDLPFVFSFDTKGWFSGIGEKRVLPQLHECVWRFGGCTLFGDGDRQFNFVINCPIEMFLGIFGIVNLGPIT